MKQKQPHTAAWEGGVFMKRAIKITTGVIFLAFAVAYSIYLLATNPAIIDMTEARMFLTFWREYLIISISFIIGYVLLSLGLPACRADRSKKSKVKGRRPKG
jgi:hypothetical protein